MTRHPASWEVPIKWLAAIIAFAGTFYMGLPL